MDFVRHFREGHTVDAMGEFQRVGPDQFPLFNADDLKPEQEAITAMLESMNPRGDPAARQIDRLGKDSASRTRALLALLDRTFAYDAKFSQPEGYALSHFFDYGGAATAMARLFDAGVDAPRVIPVILDWYNSYRFNYYAPPIVEKALAWLGKNSHPEKLAPEMRSQLVTLRAQFTDGGHGPGNETPKMIDALLGAPAGVLEPVEFWAAEALQQIAAAKPKLRDAWNALLKHAQTATAARPTAKYLSTGQKLLSAVGHEAFRQSLNTWLPRSDSGRTRPLACLSWENQDERQRMHDTNAGVLRGLLWLAPVAGDKDTVRAIGRAAISYYRKIRGIGPRAVKVGNAAVYALSQFHSPEAVGQLAMLKVRVRFGSAQKEIEKAFTAAAAALNLPRDEIEEMGVPSYGLTDVGLRVETFADGQFTATLTVHGRDVDLAWSRADGKPQKSVPAKVKADHKEDFKDLQGAVKDIAAMLPAQVERIDSLYLSQKSWPFATWKERYIDHPLIGTIARRLIWNFGPSAGIWQDARIVDVEGKTLDPAPDSRVELWHPIGRPIESVLAWRAHLDRRQIRQPFKQAYREIYLLTDAERNTSTYSNRFAAHIIRQHQFNALCAARGWKNKLRLLVDDTYPPPSRELPQWNLRTEFWVEGIGDNYGADTNESGVFLRLATDQVRFYRTGAAENYAHAGGGGYTTHAAGPGNDLINEPLPLDQIPPLVLSEILRDVDLFVGVASVGNDPAWQDGGPEGRYRTYWHNYSFGDLNETAKTRQAVLSTLVPRLKIAKVCSLSDKFLRVQGTRRAYKIHLGSGNILMEPNDQYLCIVASQTAKSSNDLFLPFEGDTTLALILSKAFLLAADDKIKDPTILRQIAT